MTVSCWPYYSPATPPRALTTCWSALIRNGCPLAAMPIALCEKSSSSSHVTAKTWAGYWCRFCLRGGQRFVRAQFGRADAGKEGGREEASTPYAGWAEHDSELQRHPALAQSAIRLGLLSLQRREDIVTWPKTAVDLERNTLKVSPGRTQNYGTPIHLEIVMGQDLREVVLV